MAKIIKDGVIPEAQAYCDICGCEFIFDRRDVKKVSAEEYYAECPCCGEKITLAYESKINLKIF